MLENMDIRERVWASAWIAGLQKDRWGNTGVAETTAAETAADVCLDAFDKRFPEHKNKKQADAGK